MQKRKYLKPAAKKISFLQEEVIAVTVSGGGAGTGVPYSFDPESPGGKTVFNDDNTIDHIG